MTTNHLEIDCYLGLGSNLNEPVNQIRTSIGHLNNLPRTAVIETSNFYRSKAWGVTDQNDFTNAVVKINTRLKPRQLLKEVKKIEYNLMQRQLNQRWHSRVIDIDLLIYGTTSLNRNDLILPHPWISERCFVIQPLLELKPHLPKHLLQQLTKHLINHSCSDQLILIKKPEFARIKPKQSL